MNNYKNIINNQMANCRMRFDFFKSIIENIEDPQLIKALEQDFIDEFKDFDPLWDQDEVYRVLNCAGSKTRDYLILKNHNLL